MSASRHPARGGAAFALLLLAGLIQAELPAQAQSLPPPPVSPPPVVNYEYDAQGNPTRTVQAPGVGGFGFATSSSYDTLNRQKTSTDAKAGVTRFGYDGRDRTVQVTDPRSLVTQSSRNGLGDVTSLVSPDTGTASHTYDAAGNLTTRTDSRGVLATYSYDALNRPTSVVYTQSGQASFAYGWTYDQTGGGFSNGIGRLTSTSHPSGSTQYSHDPQGRILTDTQRVSPASGANPAELAKTVAYGYDAAGHVTSITYPSGRVLGVTYTAGQPTARALAKDGTSTPAALIDGIQWEPFGGVRRWDWQLAGGPQANERVYDSSGRLVRYRLGTSIRDLTYDAGDRITAYTHYDAASAAATPALDQGFGYDELGRLTGIATATASWTIGYDANGNRTSLTLNGMASTYTTEATSNRLASISNPARGFGYDKAGNTTSDSTSYTSSYDLAGRLTALTKAGTTSSFSYDGMGRRVRKYIGAGTGAGAASAMIFVYDQQGQLLGEYDSSGNTIREYVWLGSTPVAVFMPDPADPTGQANPPLVYYVHTDHLDTPRVVVDMNNAIRWRWLAEPFGTTAPETDPSSLGAFTLNLRFPGQYADQETGLFYNMARYYDPSAGGRYTQPDPIGLAAGSSSLYAYVNNQPTKFVDPKGLIKWKGEMYSAGAAELIGGGVYNFDLKSACVNGKYAYIHVFAGGVGLGIGAPHFSLTGGGGPIEFNDGELDIRPDGFTGKFQIFAAGIGVGLVANWSFIELGRAISAPSSAKPDPSIGFDASVSAFIGRSAVWDVEWKDCDCSAK